MTTQIDPQTIYLTVKQVAKRYGVSTDSIWRWKNEGHFPEPVRVGKNTTRWRLSDLIEYESQLKACCVMGGFWDEAA